MKENIVSMVLDRASQYGSREVFRYRKGESYQSISWNDLTESIHRVSIALQSLNLGHADNIGIFSDNRPEWVISDLGILSVRGVVVPFYATSSREQLKYIADETQMKLIFVGNHEQYEKALWLLENTESVNRVVVFDSSIAINNDRSIRWVDFIACKSEHPLIELNELIQKTQSNDLATIIYTSGTTGDSKGVMLTHQSFQYTFKIHDERLDVKDTDVSACFLPLSHVFERTWTYYMLHCGATNVFIENPRDVIKLLPKIKPTVMCAVPRFFEKTYDGVQLELAKWSAIKRTIFNWAISIGYKRSDYLSRNKLPSTALKIKYSIANKLVLSKFRGILGGNIKFMPCAGAAICPSHLRFFHATGIFVTYGYGATETSATVSCFKSNRYDFESCGSIMPGIEVKISSHGEILVRGNTLFIGYFRKPVETGKVLIDGWYHTGDKGYLTENGDLVMTDRIKDLMKTSVGKYVSPQKIELVFAQDAYIEQIIPIGDNYKFVTALIVPSFDMLSRVAESWGLQKLTNEELIQHGDIISYYKKRVDIIQSEFNPYEKIIRFKLLSEPFSIQNGGLTNTLKVRRNKLIEHYQNLVDDMYRD